MPAPDFSRSVLACLLVMCSAAMARLPSTTDTAGGPSGDASDETRATQWLAGVDAFRGQPKSQGVSAGTATARPSPPTVLELLRSAPDDESLKALPPPLRRVVMVTIIDLRLRADDIPGAVMTLRVVDPGPDTPALAATVLRAWTRVNGAAFDKPINPAVSRRLALPVTRLTRTHNTADLAALATTLRDLLHAPPAADALVGAFVSVQGRAVAYDPDDLAKVFGSADTIDVDTLLALAAALRDNLVSAEQALVGMNAGMKAQALRDIADGYAALEKLLVLRMTTSDAWQLARQLGEVRYRRCEFGRSSGLEAQAWPRLRAAAFSAFAEAADRFERADPSSRIGPGPYEDWFNAAAGALNPSQPGTEPQPDPAQLLAMKTRIDALPPADAQRRAQRLADFVFDQARRASPEFRQQYVRAGLAVIGDRDAASPLRRAAAYYDAVLTDLKLVCSLDGTPAVGVNQVFGMRIALWHTTTLDREVGGFARLLRSGAGGTASNSPGVVPQSNLTGLVDYRARMEARLRRAVGDKLEIVSVVWSDGASLPLPAGPDGWTQTPLAYLIVKATDVTVDAFPTLQLDLDFVDKSENDRVILPVVSERVPLDARTVAARPYQVTSVTQLLDDRTLPAGGISLDIKIAGQGMLPPIDQLLDLRMTGWSVQKVSDGGLQPDRFEITTPAGEMAAPCVVSQRTCTVSYGPAGDSKDGVSLFHFPQPLTTAGAMPSIDLRRYSDGDLVPAEATVRLPGADGHHWKWLACTAGVILLLVVPLIWWPRRRRRLVAVSRSVAGLRPPESITPFTATTYLRAIRARAGHDAPFSLRQDLDREIARIEAHYYAAGRPGASAPDDDLRSLVARWASKSG